MTLVSHRLTGFTTSWLLHPQTINGIPPPRIIRWRTWRPFTLLIPSPGIVIWLTPTIFNTAVRVLICPASLERTVARRFANTTKCSSWRYATCKFVADEREVVRFQIRVGAVASKRIGDSRYSASELDLWRRMRNRIQRWEEWWIIVDDFKHWSARSQLLTSLEKAPGTKEPSSTMCCWADWRAITRTETYERESWVRDASIEWRHKNRKA